MRKWKQRQFKILAAESNQSTLNVIENILTKAGYQVQTCSSAADAVGFLEGNDLDIIITDMKIYNHIGLDAVEFVLINSKVVVIILVDECDTIEEIAKALKMGADEYLHKPFTNKELTVTVRRAIRKLVRMLPNST
jgi:DNA-binding response OmpR family regulator